MKEKYIDIVFDGPPGPVAGRFVETENQDGFSMSMGEWVIRPDGFHALRVPVEVRLMPFECEDKAHALAVCEKPMIVMAVPVGFSRKPDGTIIE